ncbi:MAG: zf-HC2 domain-containing protein [Pseudomonadota bacterium]
MECARLKELLSEYIDGTLDQETRETVEKHVSTCKGCAEELASLRSLVEELGSLEQVKPPADFMEQLHERLEAPSMFRRIVRKLFVPFHVKIPLEFATAAMIAVLVFSLFHTQLAEKHMLQTPSEKKAMEPAEIGEANKKEISLKKEVSPPKAALDATSRMEKEGEPQKPMELTLLLQKRDRGRAFKQPMALKESRTAKKGAPADEESLYPASAGATAESSRTDPLKHLIEKEGGKVLNIEYDPKTGLPAVIQAEIPTSRYDIFTHQLKGMASSLVSSPSSPDKSQERVLLQIKLLYSE